MRYAIAWNCRCLLEHSNRIALARRLFTLASALLSTEKSLAKWFDFFYSSSLTQSLKTTTLMPASYMMVLIRAYIAKVTNCFDFASERKLSHNTNFLFWLNFSLSLQSRARTEILIFLFNYFSLIHFWSSFYFRAKNFIMKELLSFCCVSLVNFLSTVWIYRIYHRRVR